MWRQSSWAETLCFMSVVLYVNFVTGETHISMRTGPAEVQVWVLTATGCRSCVQVCTGPCTWLHPLCFYLHHIPSPPVSSSPRWGLWLRSSDPKPTAYFTHWSGPELRIWPHVDHQTWSTSSCCCSQLLLFCFNNTFILMCRATAAGSTSVHFSPRQSTSVHISPPSGPCDLHIEKPALSKYFNTLNLN